MARHNELGKWGEDIACNKLIAEGYVILERNWRFGHLEVDIIAMKDGRIVFAEVKTRESFEEDPLDAMDNKKIANLANAANAYLVGSDTPYNWVQFDVFAINGTPENYKVEHIPDAFFPPLKTY